MEKLRQSDRCAQMYGLIEEWQQSGQTQKLFCEERGQNKAVFNYWLRKYREEKHTPAQAFAQVEPTGNGQVLELVYPNGVILRLPAGTAPLCVRSYIML